MQRRITAALNDQTVRFFITGGSAAALFFALTYGFIHCGAAPFGGTVAAYAIAFVVSYTAQHHWTFGGRLRHSTSLPRYMAAQLGSAVVSGCIARVASAANLPPAAVALASTLVGSALSYGLSRYWVFAPRD